MAGGLAAVGLPLRGAAGPTAQDVIKEIQERLGGDWDKAGVDGFKAGSPDARVDGIATTAMATMNVLRQAADKGINLIVSYEPTFFGSRDGAPPPAGARGGAGRGPAFGVMGLSEDDPVIKAKRDFIQKNGLVVFRLRDHWRDRKESGMTTGLADSLGWAGRRVSGETMLYEVPPATLADTVAHVRKRLNLRGGLRCVGDPASKVRRVMLYPGQMPIATMWKRFDETDLLIAGEVREWECVPYALDVNQAGEKRSLMTLGRIASEDPGMRACALWLRTFMKGVPVEWISAGDIYWRAA